MNGSKVLDSYSLIAYFEDEPGAPIIEELLKQSRNRQQLLFLSVVNWGEIYYITQRVNGNAAAEKILQTLDDLPIEVVNVDREQTKIAAGFKAKHKMSYADCFAAALAKIKKATLATGDKEFREIERAVKILWI